MYSERNCDVREFKAEVRGLRGLSGAEDKHMKSHTDSVGLGEP